MVIAITGASGFIGRHLVAKLGDSVKAIDRFGVKYLDGKFENLSSKGLKDPDFYKFFDNVDVVVHLAGLAHRKLTLDDINENMMMFENIIYSAHRANVKRIVYVSSVSIFGSIGQINKESVPCPRTLESSYKLKCESILIDLARSFNIEFVIIRSPLVYGEGVKANFSKILKSVSLKLPLPLRSITNNRRSLVSVYNLIDLINVCVEHPSAKNQVFLVSDDDDLSTSRMIALMAKVQGKANLSLPVPVWCLKLVGKVFRKETMVDLLVGSLQLDIEHTKTTLGWVPPYTVEHGFKLTVRNIIKN